MRINQYIARATGLSRRKADAIINQGRVTINGLDANLGSRVNEGDQVALDKRSVTPLTKTVTIMLHKPVGYVSSRRGQGSRTIYELLPTEYRRLKPVGRLDKDSSGLLLLTDDGRLANRLTHPRYNKVKVYEVALDKPLTAADKKLLQRGVELEDGLSRLMIGDRGQHLTVSLSEGRNRQIRRTFAALGYTVHKLHRISFGEYLLGGLKEGDYTPSVTPMAR